MSQSSKNSIFIVFTGIIIALGRYLLEETSSADNQEHILITMAVVNYVALGFVLLFLFNDLKKDCTQRIEKSGSLSTVKKKCLNIISIHTFLFMILYLIFGLLYVNKYRTSGYNDVISIIALALSIASPGLIIDFGKYFYKYIIKLSKLHIQIPIFRK